MQLAVGHPRDALRRPDGLRLRGSVRPPPLGDARTSSVGEIWTGPVLSRLREDLNSGGSTFCGDCALKLPPQRRVASGSFARRRPLPARMFIECTAACNISCTEACCAPETGITRTRESGIKRLGLRTTAVFSEADAGALHVRVCDEAYAIGPFPGARQLSRHRQDHRGRNTPARGVHPGVTAFSRRMPNLPACARAGIVFVGPTPAAMRAMGLKDRAKAFMAKAGVPVVPGYHGERQKPAFSQAEGL